MKPIGKRIDEFINYHINGDGECNNVVLRNWADKHQISLQEKYELAYFFSITYCVESAIVLFQNRIELFFDVELWVAENKHKLIFQSDRKYIRMKDSFQRCLNNFITIRQVNLFLEKVMEKDIIVLSKAIPMVSSWALFGRFSAFLFLETFVELTGIPVENSTIEWEKGNTATSGLLNVFGFDDAAEIFDKTGKLLIKKDIMDKMLNELLMQIEKQNGVANVTEVETSLCAYRKFYKGSRYNGYYLDRMLEEILGMEKDFPEVSQELLGIRSKCFHDKQLGEVSGWNGIRKDMKKAYLKTGVII